MCGSEPSPNAFDGACLLGFERSAGLPDQRSTAMKQSPRRVLLWFLGERVALGRAAFAVAGVGPGCGAAGLSALGGVDDQFSGDLFGVAVDDGDAALAAAHKVCHDDEHARRPRSLAALDGGSRRGANAVVAAAPAGGCRGGDCRTGATAS